MSLSDEEITQLIRPAGFSMVSAFADRAVIMKFARTIERAATIEAYKHCAGHCDNKRGAASAAAAIRAEIARLEAEK